MSYFGQPPPQRVIALRCVSCGGKLEISPDMERFACGYCGTEQMVERRGGTVTLKGVEEAISRVQAGTDRTAAELALNRLSGELQSVSTQRSKLEAQMSQAENAGCWPSAIAAFVLFAIGGSLMPKTSGQQDAASSAIAVIFLVLAIVVGVWIFRAVGRNATQKVGPHLEAIRAKEHDLYQKIEKHRRIVDS